MEGRFATLTHSSGSELRVRVNERRISQLSPVLGGAPIRGAWLAQQWTACGYNAINGAPITPASVCSALEGGPRDAL